MCNNLAQRYNKNNHKARKGQEILHLLHIFLHRFRVASGREMPYTYHTHTIHIPYTYHTHAIPLSMATVWYHRENTEASPLVAILVAYSYSLFEYVYSLGRTRVVPLHALTTVEERPRTTTISTVAAWAVQQHALTMVEEQPRTTTISTVAARAVQRLVQTMAAERPPSTTTSMVAALVLRRPNKIMAVEPPPPITTNTAGISVQARIGEIVAMPLSPSTKLALHIPFASSSKPKQLA